MDAVIDSRQHDSQHHDEAGGSQTRDLGAALRPASSIEHQAEQQTQKWRVANLQVIISRSSGYAMAARSR
jgi:hypothetical protein